MRISTANRGLYPLRNVLTCSGYKVGAGSVDLAHAITAHRLVVLAEVNTVSQDWGNLFFKLSLAEALEKVATSITEEAWLYNENAFYFCFDYIHCSCFNFCCYNKIFRITPSLFPKRAPLSPQAPLPQEAGM